MRAAVQRAAWPARPQPNKRTARKGRGLGGKVPRPHLPGATLARDAAPPTPPNSFCWLRVVKTLFAKLDNTVGGRYLNLQDNEFVHNVTTDLQHFVTTHKNQRSVLIFPPVSNYRRFLIHKLCEETYTNLKTFSVGQGLARRTVVCFQEHLIRKLERNASDKPTVTGLPNHTGRMVVDRQHLTNSDEGAPVLTSATKKVRSSAPLNIYRPPALRKRNEALEVSSCDSSPEIVPVQKAERLRPAKQRRPDIQVYVPRAKRILATPEHNERSPAALRSTPPENKKTSSTKKSGDDKDSRRTPSKTKQLDDKSSCHQQLQPASDDRKDLSITSNNKNNNKNVDNFYETNIDIPSAAADRSALTRSSERRDRVICGEVGVEVISDQGQNEERVECVAEILSRCAVPLTHTNSLAEDCCHCGEVQREQHECEISGCRTDFPSGLCAENVSEPVLESAKTVTDFHEEVEDCCKTCNRTLRLCDCNISNCVDTINENSEVGICPPNLDSLKNVDSVEESIVNVGERSVEEEDMKDCSLGQESRDLGVVEDISHKPTLETSSNTSEQNSFFQKVPQDQVEDKNANIAKDSVDDVDKNAPVSEGSVLSDVLIISDNSDSLLEPSISLDSKGSGSNNSVGNTSGPTAQEKQIEQITPSADNSVSTDPTQVRLNPDECTWEMMFDDNGDCLDPKLIEEITNAVGSVKIEKPKSDYNGYQNKPEIILDPGDEFSHVIEIYNFPAAFKTEDLVTIFSPYKNGGFEIKWVDNTHALGIFSSSFVAAEVLAAEHPFVKTRPLREASHESRMKARRSAEFLQPYKVRPETCAALARRLVTGALGVKVNVTREEREAERRLLREAREKKRLAAKQRDEIWEGTFSAN
ncbi:uncharacterized protein LOC124613430 [Schistocerca americana]|uniref:uncharacterized protein LOC124613430 n=1 Tax=Schistocerca americana TaxID=7009 RepID=UPI001F4F4093|nr:uncharacterized protein LOC124613430 [Schistocerca americana]